MYNHLLYLLYWAVNSVVLYISYSIFPKAVVLGNARLTPIEAAIYAGFWLAFFVWMMWDFVFVRGVKLEPPPLAFVYFLFVNALGVWLVARFAHITGLGIANYGWAFVVGTFADITQRLVWKLVVGKRSKALT